MLHLAKRLKASHDSSQPAEITNIIPGFDNISQGLDGRLIFKSTFNPYLPLANDRAEPAITELQQQMIVAALDKLFDIKQSAAGYETRFRIEELKQFFCSEQYQGFERRTLAEIEQRWEICVNDANDMLQLQKWYCPLISSKLLDLGSMEHNHKFYYHTDLSEVPKILNQGIASQNVVLTNNSIYLGNTGFSCNFHPNEDLAPVIIEVTLHPKAKILSLLEWQGSTHSKVLNYINRMKSELLYGELIDTQNKLNNFQATGEVLKRMLILIGIHGVESLDGHRDAVTILTNEVVINKNVYTTPSFTNNASAPRPN